MRIYGFFIIFICIFVTLVCSEIEDYPYYIRQDVGYNVLWVANSGDNTVTCIDRIHDRIIGTYEVGPSPSRTAVDLDGNCWVGSRGDGTVYFVTKRGETTRFDGFSRPRGVALDREGNVWIANSSGTIQRITVDTGAVSEQVSIACGGFFYGALIDSAGFLWILVTNGTMVKYDISQFPDLNACETVTVSPMYGFTIDMNGKVWVAGGSKLHKIDADSATLEISYDVTGASSGVTVDIDGNIWICYDGGSSVIKFDPATATYETFPVEGSGPHGLGADEFGYVYSVNMGSGDVSKIDARSGEVVLIYPVGNGPYTYSDLTGFIYRNVTLKQVRYDIWK